MKSKKLVLLVGILVVAVLLTTPGLASSQTIEVDFIELYCSYETGEWWWEGNVYHERDSLMVGYYLPIDPNDPVDYGSNGIWLNLNYNTAMNSGTGSGKFATNYESGFIGHWNGKMVNVGNEQNPIWIITPDHPAITVGFGIGDFEGWKLKTTFYHIDPTAFLGNCPDGGDPLFAAFHHAVYTKP